MKRVVSIVIASLMMIQLVGCGSTKVNGSDAQNPYRLGDIISYDAGEIALNSLISDEKVEVTDGKYIIFTPKENVQDTGFIFYPGGLVEAEAYAPIMRKITEQGYKVVIVPMMMNLSVLGGTNKAESVIENNPDIDKWVIGGHSLGGVSACSFAPKNEKIEGVVLYASYPQGDELKDTDLKILSLWGSRDKVADLEKVKGAKEKMNSNCEFIEIEGGNHGHFGDYGEQKGDGESTITTQEQWNAAVKYTVEFLKQFS